jgi:hypothetical protein
MVEASKTERVKEWNFPVLVKGPAESLRVFVGKRDGRRGQRRTKEQGKRAKVNVKL